MWDRLAQAEIERPTLRIRLVGAALGATILLLGAGLAAGGYGITILVLYLAAAVLLRFLLPAYPSRWLPLVGIGLDFLMVSALVTALPLGLPVWSLYVIAIGTSALRYGPHGAVVATAVAPIGYDLLLARSEGAATFADLWPIQVLLASGMIAVELSLARLRDQSERGHLRRHVLALRSVAATEDATALLDALVGHVANAGGAAGAWIWTAQPDGSLEVTNARGRLPRGVEHGHLGDWRARPGEIRSAAELVPDAGEIGGIALPLASDPPTLLGVLFEGVPFQLERRLAFVRDLASDSAPLLAAAYARSRERRRAAMLQATLAAASAIAAQQSEAAVMAELVLGANAIAGRAAVVRLADGSVVAGDLPERGIELTLGLGRGIVTERRLSEHEAQALRRLGDIAAAATDRIRERDELAEATRVLRSDVERLGGVIRAKEDAVAMAVHELRNPLTSVQGYARLMSRHLVAVQRQVSQLDRLIADLLRSGGPTVAETAASDVAQEIRDAINRLRLVSEARLEFEAPHEPARAAIEGTRLAQVLDNLLSNAVKYSPSDEPITLEIHGGGEQVVLSVRDRGHGIDSADLDRIFERFYRAPRDRNTAGEGLGLAICKEIVTAHGGRIWATSLGDGTGSTFWVALPKAPLEDLVPHVDSTP